MVDQRQHFDVCSVVNDRQTGKQVQTHNSCLSNLIMDNKEVEPVTFTLLFPYREDGYTTDQRGLLSPDAYAIARLLRPEKINGSFTTVQALYAPFYTPLKHIDRQTGEPFLPEDNAMVVEQNQVENIVILRHLIVNRFMFIARLAQY
jgi:hypothetical protein